MAEKFTNKFVFPKTSNLVLPIIIMLVLGAAAYLPVLAGVGMSPEATDVGYEPEQPVPYSHELHVGQLGLDCKYCHTTVDRAGFAAIPPAQTCMNCHTTVRTNSDKLKPLRDAWTEGKAVEWVKVHDLPDYAFFNHSAHVNKGVSCVECHGRVDRMAVVYQAKNLSMGWCLDCHRNPANVLRPKDQVTNLGFKPADLANALPGTESAAVFAELKAQHPNDEITQPMLGDYLKTKYGIRDNQFMTSCSTCHR